MTRLTELALFLDPFCATLTSGLMVLASWVVLKTQLVSSASAEVTFLNKWGNHGRILGVTYIRHGANGERSNAGIWKGFQHV